VTLRISSPAFVPGGPIPAAHTCDGRDTSPALEWTGVPPGTRSLALIVDDPDAPDPAAPRMIWVHWVLYNIPPACAGLAEGVAPDDLPPGTRQGINDSGRAGYSGPCPPIGTHRYFHRLHALDSELPDLGPRASRAAVDRAMSGHVIAAAELMGTFER
jgi:Raf kinase inhibitor-like YbhB/YbcL family protein